MKLKEPLVLDISHWELISDFSVIAPRPALIITKATESILGVDGKFIEYFAGMKNATIPRGCYHFFRKAFDAKQQAQHFVNFIKPHVNDSDILALDIEEGGETASQIITFCDYVQNALPRNLFVVYSTKLLLNAILMTQVQKERLRNIPTWIAGYPDEPDLFDSVPSWHIPDQSKWGAVWLWQYSEHGIVAGVTGEVDLNWINPIFLEKLPLYDPPSQASSIDSLLVYLDSGEQIRFNKRGE